MDSPWTQENTLAMKFHTVRAGGSKQTFQRPSKRRKWFTCIYGGTLNHLLPCEETAQVNNYRKMPILFVKCEGTDDTAWKWCSKGFAVCVWMREGRVEVFLPNGTLVWECHIWKFGRYWKSEWAVVVSVRWTSETIYADNIIRLSKTSCNVM